MPNSSAPVSPRWPDRPVLRATRRLAPGLALVAVGLVVALGVNALLPAVSTLVAAVVIGAIAGNAGATNATTTPGISFAAKRLMRVGVVLLGLRLSIGDIADLGVLTLGVIIVTVFTTFFGAQFVGRRIGLSPGFSLLVGTGFGICGVSAIAAVEGASDASEEEVAAAMGLVTLFGTIAIFTIPPLGTVIGLDDEQFGTWVGAGIHDTAQVVAAASTGGAAALTVAVAVKLTRVMMLAPIVAGVNLRRAATAPAEPAGRRRPPLLPLCVAGFLTCVGIRTSSVLSDDVLDVAKQAEGLLLASAMVGLGASVEFRRLRALGVRPLILGAIAWAGVAGSSLAAILVTS
ncbi:MAG: YeiH family protein [Ilumatobacter sp.]